jgi:hypothetical protein
LQRVMLAERGLQWREVAVVRQAFNGYDFRAVHLRREHQACAHGVAIDQDRAGATHAMLASHMRARQAQVMTQAIGKREPGLNLDRDLLAIYFETERD